MRRPQRKLLISIELPGIPPNISTTVTNLKMFLRSFSSIRGSLGQKLAISKASSKKNPLSLCTSFSQHKKGYQRLKSKDRHQIAITYKIR